MMRGFCIDLGHFGIGMMTRLCWVVILGVAYTCEAGVNVWTGKGPDSGAVFRVSVSPTNPSTVYACGPVGYRVSTDGGTSWTPLDDAGIDDNARDCFEIVATANALYRCSWGSGCFRSSDGGASWSLLSTRIETGPSVAADSTGQVVLIADYAGVQRSTDSGMTWSKVLNTHSYSVGARMVAFDLRMIPRHTQATLAASSSRRTADGAGAAFRE
jgi:hypothetical protein